MHGRCVWLAGFFFFSSFLGTLHAQSGPVLLLSIDSRTDAQGCVLGLVTRLLVFCSPEPCVVFCGIPVTSACQPSLYCTVCRVCTLSLLWQAPDMTSIPESGCQSTVPTPCIRVRGASMRRDVTRRFWRHGGIFKLDIAKMNLATARELTMWHGGTVWGNYFNIGLEPLTGSIGGPWDQILI